MQILECQTDFYCIEASPILIKAALHLLKVEEKLATVHELHDQVQTLIVLKCVLKSHDERVIELFENLTLDTNAGHLVCLDEQVFQYRLHGKDLLCLIVLHQVDLAIGTASNSPQDSEVALLHG